jgi:hypothetical protein
MSNVSPALTTMHSSRLPRLAAWFAGAALGSMSMEIAFADPAPACAGLPPPAVANVTAATASRTDTAREETTTLTIDPIPLSQRYPPLGQI